MIRRTLHMWPAALLVALLSTPSTRVGAQIQIPVQFIRIANDDGSDEGLMTPAQAKGWIDFANQVYASQNIQFTFNAIDSFTTVKRTLYNEWQGDIDARNLTLNFPDKMPILIPRHAQPQSNALGDMIISYGYPEAAQSDGTHQGWHLPHEIGHHLGLPHTFWQEFKYPDGSFMPFAEAWETAKQDLRNNDYDPAVWDGDGFGDTPPHPLLPGHRELGGPSSFAIDVEVPGGGFRTVHVTNPRSNIMGYFDYANAITTEQGVRARWWANYYASHGWHYPTNKALQGTWWDASVQNHVNPVNASVSMAGGPPFSLVYDQHARISFTNGGRVSFNFYVGTAGTYDVNFYGVRDYDYGRASFTVDNLAIGSQVDAYAPSVAPTGRIHLGNIGLAVGTHRFTVRSTGKSSLSIGYDFGIDAVELIPHGVTLPPGIYRHPVGQVAIAGSTVTFQAGSYGNPLSYQWRKNGSNIPGATAARLTLPNVQAADAASYTVRVSNSSGQQTSQPATLEVRAAPTPPFSFEGEAFGDRATNVVLARAAVGSFEVQDMAPFGSGWSGGRQLLVDTTRSLSSITLGLPVEKEGSYKMDVYLTRAPDFGRFQTYIDGAAFGPIIDLYGPIQPTGAIRLGTRWMPFGVRKVEFRCIGKNSASSYYALGIDKIVLAP